MKFKTQFILIPILCVLTMLFSIFTSNGQSYTQNENIKRLSLEEALTLAGAKNKWIDIDSAEELAAQAEKKDARLMAFPQFEAKASYLRYSNLSVYEDGLGGRSSAPRYPTPNEASLGLEGTFNVYSGGRIKAIQEQQSIKNDIAALNVRERSGSIKLQTTSYYLGLIRLYDLKRFTTDQLKRAELRLTAILNRVSFLDFETSERLNSYVQMFSSKGYTTEQATSLAYSSLGRAVDIQAQILGYRAVFLTIAIMLCIVLFLIAVMPSIHKTVLHYKSSLGHS